MGRPLPHVCAVKECDAVSVAADEGVFFDLQELLFSSSKRKSNSSSTKVTMRPCKKIVLLFCCKLSSHNKYFGYQGHLSTSAIKKYLRSSCGLYLQCFVCGAAAINVVQHFSSDNPSPCQSLAYVNSLCVCSFGPVVPSTSWQPCPSYSKTCPIRAKWRSLLMREAASSPELTRAGAVCSAPWACKPHEHPRR